MRKCGNAEMRMRQCPALGGSSRWELVGRGDFNLSFMLLNFNDYYVFCFFVGIPIGIPCEIARNLIARLHSIRKLRTSR